MVNTRKLESESLESTFSLKAFDREDDVEEFLNYPNDFPEDIASVREYLNALRDGAQNHPDKIAIIDGDFTCTYRRFHEYAMNLRYNYLEKYGRGGSVAFIGSNSFTLALLIFAFSALFSPRILLIPASMTPRQIEQSFEILKPTHFVRLDPMSHNNLAESGVTELHINALKDETFNQDLFDLPELQRPLSEHLPAIKVVMPTSGTTGIPKFVPMPLLRVANSIKTSSNVFNVKMDYVLNTNMAWLSGFFATLCTLTNHGTLIIMRDYTFESYLDLMLTHRPFYVFWQPQTINSVLSLPEETQKELKSFVKMIGYGGSRTPAKILRQAIYLFDTSVFLQVYASTEGNMISIMSPPVFQQLKAGKLPEAVLDSAGIAYPGSLVKILNDNQEELPKGSVGMIYVHSVNVFPGYVGNFEQTQSCLFVDGKRRLWYKTGDEGYFDEHDFLHVHGRTGLEVVTLSNTLIVYVREIEQVILSVPGVSEVSVFGVEDVDDMTTICAYISLEIGANSEMALSEIKSECKKNLPVHAVPSNYIVLPVGRRLPHNHNGKIDIKTMKMSAEKRLFGE